MRPSAKLAAIFASMWAIAAFAACSRSGLSLYAPAEGETDPQGAASSAASSSSGAGGGGGSATSSSAGGGGTMIDAGMDAPDDVTPPPVVEDIFVHSGTTLYLLDVPTLTLITIAPFSGCGGTVLDIAASATGPLYASTTAGLYRVAAGTGVCTQVATGSYPNSLAIVAKGILDPNNEALVGFLGEVYVRIDQNDGTFTIIGNLGNQGYQSSGDVVIMPNGRGFLTVNGNGCDDCLVEIDPVSGALMQIVTELDYSAVYGLASSESRAFGFDAAGNAFLVDIDSGETTALPLVEPSLVPFYGAASRPAMGL